MTRPGTLLAVLLALSAALSVAYADFDLNIESLSRYWQHAVHPGLVTRGHARLEGTCDACHTPLLGPDNGKCVACHADNRNLLQRQSTAFHVDIGACRDCHFEHLGRDYVSRRMDHVALARIGARNASRAEISSSLAIPGIFAARPPLPARPDNLLIAAGEGALDCAGCHARRDRHQGQFGEDCGACHGTQSWRIPGSIHPSGNTTECAQCHLEPPSHRMMHFEMISKTVAGQEHAKVRQCFLCHQTTSWNDIKGVGWYKHH